jgi:hypothetical protein
VLGDGVLLVSPWHIIESPEERIEVQPFEELRGRHSVRYLLRIVRWRLCWVARGMIFRPNHDIRTLVWDEVDYKLASQHPWAVVQKVTSSPIPPASGLRRSCAGMLEQYGVNQTLSSSTTNIPFLCTLWKVDTRSEIVPMVFAGGCGGCGGA